jgi:ABC-2 type transport system permease protein
MHPRLILAIARKDALDILLNRSTLSILASPILLALLFLGIGSLLGSKTTNALIYNPGKSGVEQVLKGAYQDIKITYANSPDTVSNTFGPDGTHKSSPYTLGLVVPSDFESSLRAGGHPQLQLFLNGDTLSNQQRVLLQGAIANYSRNIANPQPPASISVATINPPKIVDTSTYDINIMYSATLLLISFYAGTSIVPGMLTEEKERKTLRMLMVTPASFGDVVLGKLLVGLSYQIILTLAVVAIEGGYMGQIPLILFFAVLGSCFSVSLGLLAGSLFQTTSTAGMFSGITSAIYIAPIFFVGLFYQLLGDTPFTPFIKVLPTYYIADGVTKALQNAATWSNLWVDVSVVVGSIVLLLAIATWGLRRQAAVVATI